MAHVFICYDREDRDFAEVTQAKLEKAGHETSMDFDILAAGDDWQTKLDLAIRNSDAVVVIMTPEARASDYVAYEWAFALGAGVKVIPLELRATEFPPRLDGLHRLDFTEKNRPWDTLLAEVTRADGSSASSSIAGDPGTPGAMKQAVRAVDSLVAGERQAAIKTLAQTDHPAALDALTRALEHPIKDVRIAAAGLFPDRTNPRILPGLIEGYLDALETWMKSGAPGDPPAPKQVFDAIPTLGASATPALLNTLKSLGVESRHFLPRRAILDALGRTRNAAAVPALQEALQDKEAGIRSEAAEALGQLGVATGATALRSALSDPVWHVREYAARSLGLLRDAGAVSALIECLRNDTSSVRATAAKALGEIGDASSVPALIAALPDENNRVKAAVVAALGRLGDAAAISHLRPLLNPADTGSLTDLDMEVMAALVRLRDTESFDAIANRLISFRSGSYGGDVYKELARHGEEGVNALLRLLSSDSQSRSTQSEAVKALASVRTPEVVNTVRAWKRKHDIQD
ncbi:MAG TPA: HEAT repeat domain-containing protein [Vicinamibacterales bacterium]|jgi:HEAT repeat protein|nr:HEAT repeat domain-containing protein [Vicinamibacterales bacterium]